MPAIEATISQKSKGKGEGGTARIQLRGSWVKDKSKPIGKGQMLKSKSGLKGMFFGRGGRGFPSILRFAFCVLTFDFPFATSFPGSMFVTPNSGFQIPDSESIAPESLAKGSESMIQDSDSTVPFPDSPDESPIANQQSPFRPATCPKRVPFPRINHQSPFRPAPMPNPKSKIQNCRVPCPLSHAPFPLHSLTDSDLCVRLN